MFKITRETLEDGHLFFQIQVNMEILQMPKKKKGGGVITQIVI